MSKVVEFKLILILNKNKKKQLWNTKHFIQYLIIYTQEIKYGVEVRTASLVDQCEISYHCTILKFYEHSRCIACCDLLMLVHFIVLILAISFGR